MVEVAAQTKPTKYMQYGNSHLNFLRERIEKVYLISRAAGPAVFIMRPVQRKGFRRLKVCEVFGYTFFCFLIFFVEP